MKIKILLILIVILAGLLRLYKLDSVPPSISWDEAAVGYNAWTIANWGRDEYGKLLPVYFKSFADDKHPVHIYTTALSVKFFGLSEFSTRLPSALFGIFNVILIFFLAKLMFSSEILGLFAAFSLTISPANIHFSRFNHEANFALFFLMLGLTLFYLAVKKKKSLLALSVLSFGLAFLTYHPSKVVVPAVAILLSVLYGKQLLRSRFNLAGVFTVSAAFSLLIILNPQLLGIARVNQTSLSKDIVKKTQLFQMTNNELLGRLELVFTQYSWHFSPQYLFLSGDKNPRLSDQKTGQFYPLEAFFLLLGIIFLGYRRSKEGVVLLAWAFVAPLPSALVAEAPHSARAMFMMGSWHLIAALGFYWLFNLFKKPVFKLGILILTLGVLLFSLSVYTGHYFVEYARRNAIDWQYGMKQIVEYAKDHPEYSQVYTTAVRSQPYIFFLYYLKTPLPQYLNTVIYNNSQDKSYNSVSYFERYEFGGWSPFESDARKGVLYALSPSEYDGLKYRSNFEVKKIVYYPNDATAFFLVTLK